MIYVQSGLHKIMLVNINIQIHTYRYTGVQEMDPRTLRKLVVALEKEGCAATKIQGYSYDLEYNSEIDAVSATPRGPGNKATSLVQWDDYVYTHGGNIFRLAVQWCREVHDELRKKWSGREEVK